MVRRRLCGPGSALETVSVRAARAVHHCEYVFPDGEMDVYDMDRGQHLVEHVAFPQLKGIRGVAAAPRTGMLYVSYGGDGGGWGNGSMLGYSLRRRAAIWTRNYPRGVDSMAITPDGRTIYMPDGEISADGIWYLINAATGLETGATVDTHPGTGDNGPHNTIVSLDGRYVYMGDRNYNAPGSNYFYVASARTNRVVKRVGPFRSGIRPFTVNGRGTLVYTSVTGFLGFQVGDITTGRVLYTVPFSGYSWNGGGPSDPSHGISLSPNERELYVLDWPNGYVHVFDVSRVPAQAPRPVTVIRLTRSMNHNESPCGYDLCLATGWLQHSRNGRYVYVGDSGDVIDTRTRRVIANLQPLYNSRKTIEIDWQGGRTVFTTSRAGLGYVRRAG